jgi:uncharacterized protein YdcH (DUF465 family)
MSDNNSLASQLNNSIQVENEQNKYTKRSNAARVGDYVRAGFQGLTFGTADEIEASVRSLFSQNKSFNQILKGIRADINNFRETNPKAAIGTEIVGAIAPSIALQFIPGIGQSATAANVGRMATLGKSAATGALGGFAYGVGTAEGNIAERVTDPDALTAGAISAVLNPAIQALAPVASKSAKELIKKGVKVLPGQAVKESGVLGKAFGRLEESVAGNVFLIGDAITTAMNRARGSFNVAAMNEVLAPIGVKTPQNLSGTALIAFGNKKIGDAYKGLLPKLKIKNSDMFGAALLDSVNNLDDDIRQDITRRVNNYILKNLKKPKGLPQNVKAQPILRGDAIKQAQAFLRRDILRLKREGSEVALRKADALEDIRSTLSMQLQMENPKLAEKLANIDKSYGLFEIVKNASIRRKQEELFTPVDLLQASAKSDVGKRNIQFATGEARMQKLAQQGQDVIGATVPDSGTSGRREAARIVTGTGAMQGAGAVGDPLLAGGLALTGPAMYSQAGVPITRSALRLAGAGMQGAVPVASAMTADDIRQMIAEGLFNRQ